MFIVRHLKSMKVHSVKNEESRNTLCGKPCVSNIVNDCNYGFTYIRNTDDMVNKPKVTCKLCLSKIQKTEGK